MAQCRLRALRQACFSSIGGDVNPDDCFLLFVAGQDGRNNGGSAAALQYLFLGFSGRLLAGSAGDVSSLSASSLPDALEDVVLVVAPDHARVYYSGESVDVVARLVSCLGNTVEWTLLAKEMEDMERAERFKVLRRYGHRRSLLLVFET